MFQVVTIQDNVRVEPDQLGRTTPDAIKAALSQSFLDKVVADVGLVISVYDIQKISGGFIYPSDPAAHFSVTFRLAVFVPFVGEVIVGRLVKSSTAGLHLSLGFFSDILVPPHALPEPSVFHEETGNWCWKWMQEDGDEVLDMWLEVGDEVRFRVHNVKFHPVPTKQDMQAATERGEIAVGTTDRPYAPMEVIAGIATPGLGVTAWWEEGEAEEEGDVADEAEPVEG